MAEPTPLPSESEGFPHPFTQHARQDGPEARGGQGQGRERVTAEYAEASQGPVEPAAAGGPAPDAEVGEGPGDATYAGPSDVPAEGAGLLEYLCPECGGAMAVDTASADVFLRCPHCDAEFIRPLTEDDDEAAREALEARRAAHDIDLDGLRIRNLSVGRRAAIRSRSYLLVGALFCVLALAILVVDAVMEIRLNRGLDFKAGGYLLFAAAAAVGAVFCARRAHAFTLELRQSSLTEPEAPPDFSTLSDGSQHWKNLEDLR